MFKNKKVLWVVIILVIVLAGLLYFRFKDNGVPRIKTATVYTDRIESIVSATGMLKAPIYDLGVKGSGRISEILVKEGQKVSKGDLLVKFDTYEEARKNFDRTRSLYYNSLASDQAFDSAKTILDASRIVAPAGGVIAKINYDVGESPLPGSSVIVVVDGENSWVEAQVDEIDIGKIMLGQTAEVTSDVYPDKKYYAYIYWIAPLAELRKVGERVKPDEESYVFITKLKFLGSHNDLKTNMSVNVDVLTNRKDGAIVIPREALFSDDDTNYIFKIKNGRAYKSKISIGIRSYTSIEAVSGIAQGDVIALSKLKEIKDKGRVIIE